MGNAAKPLQLVERNALSSPKWRSRWLRRAILYRNQVRKVRRVSVMANKALVDDMAQDTFLIAYRRIDTFEAGRPFYPWLKGIAVNVMRGKARKMKAMPMAAPEAFEAQLARLAAEQAEQAGDSDLIAYLRDCVSRLGDKAKRMINARYFGGTSVIQMAADSGSTPKAVAQALVRIRRGLRQCIERHVGREKLA